MEPARERKPKYDLLEFKPREPIPYIFGIRVDDIYVSNYKCWRMSISEIAKDGDMPEKVIRQAIEWCTENDDLITKVLAKERKEAGIKD